MIFIAMGCRKNVVKLMKMGSVMLVRGRNNFGVLELRKNKGLGALKFLKASSG